MPRITGKQGFTLTEMMVVIAIIAIMAAIVVPNLKPYMAERRLNGAARQVMSDLMAARMTAVSQNRKVKVFFVGDHQYKTCDDANGDGTVADGEGTVQNRNIQPEYFDVTLAKTADPVFQLNGTATGTQITVTNWRGTKTVRVATTGRVLIE